MTTDKLKDLIDQIEKNGHIATAVELLRIYIAATGTKGYHRFLLGENLRVLGCYDEAEHLLGEGLEVPESKLSRVELSRGELRKALGDLVGAERHFRLAAELDPGSTVPWVFLGALLSGSGRLQEAKDVFTRACSAEGDLDEVHLNLGNICRALRDNK